MDYNSYQDAINWLFSRLPMFSRVGAPAYKPGLENTEALDRIFGHPHRKFKSIHVAGTNGKGSTSHLIAAVLQAAGYKTGLYTSPHLTDFRERMRINGTMIPEKDVVEFVNSWKNRQSNLHPSFFELTMMMAFDWFAREEVDFAVIEVGMGGRLDSTNVITPELSVITNISFDHTQFLGDTLRAIAAEKAGIIKPGIPVVIGEAESEVKEVFNLRADEVEAPIYFSEYLFRSMGARLRYSAAGWKCILPDGGRATVPLKGEYQKYNIRTVISAIALLQDSGVEIPEKAIRDGLENVCALTGLRGRWQIVGQAPDVICDTGHNIAGIKENLSTLKRDYKDRKVKFVIGFVNDKDVAHIVDLFPKDAEYYFTQASIPRAMKAEDVAEAFRKVGIKGIVIPGVKDAYEAAEAAASPSDVIYVGGSTFVVADFLATHFTQER